MAINSITPNGKELQILRDKSTAQYKIQFTTGGELPLELSGIFTNETYAQTAVNQYLDKQESKKKVSTSKED
jgi:hypothetical protein